jgi:hypothetical protein
MTRRMPGPGRLLAAAGLLLGGAAVRPAPSLAQEAGRWEINAFGGGFFGSRTFTSPELHVRMVTAPTFGLRLGCGVTKSYALEAGWSHASSRLVPTDPETGAPAGPETPVTINTYELDVLYWIGGGRVRGYLGVGGGLMHLKPSVQTLDRASSAQFAANFAVGGTYGLDRAFALRVDARYRWRGGRTRVGEIVCYPDGCQPFMTNIFSSAEISGGVMYRF